MGATSIREREAPNLSTQALVRILRGSLAAGASDLHLRADHAPVVRMQGELHPLEHPPLSASFIEGARDHLAGWAGTPAEKLAQKQGDFACEVPGVGRFRVHFYRQMGSAALVLRAIPTPVPSFSDLRVPPVVKRLVDLPRGLVLITGATGNGKSTTIASLLSLINEERTKHIVTIENPIEFPFHERRSTFSQREVGRDVDDVESGLIGALREDPDWIFVGEIRTQAELEIALSAGEAGHVVLSTFHSQDAVRTIHRMIGLFATSYRDAARERIADVLAGVISQRLVPRRGSRDRVLATEVLLRAPTIQDCIREPSRIRGLHQALEAGTSEYGTHTFDQTLVSMVRDGLITPDTARAAATRPTDLVRALKMGKRW